MNLRPRNPTAKIDTSGADPRWMGRVFMGGTFEKTGDYVNEGSHGRAVPVWTLKNAAGAAVRAAS